MSERLDKKYLKPQILIFERAFKEWCYIFLFIVYPWFIYSYWDEEPLIVTLITGIVPFAFGMMFYMVLRTPVPTYFAMRKVVMEDDDKSENM